MNEEKIIKRLNQFNFDICSQEIEMRCELPPIMKKYAYYKQNKEFIEPFICNVEEKYSIDKIEENLKLIIERQSLMRSIVTLEDDELKILKYNKKLGIPRIRLGKEERLEDIIYLLSKYQMKIDKQKNAMYSIVLIEKSNKIYVCAVFSHMIFDGGFPLSRYINDVERMSENTIKNFFCYLHNLPLDQKSDFTKYKEIKKIMIREYLSEEVMESMMEVEVKNFYKYKKISIEEFWVLVIGKSLFNIFGNEIESIPINILTNGRTFADFVEFKDFGDFHDEIILLCDFKESFNKIINLYREYRKKTYLNSKNYALSFSKDDETLSFIEPIILLIAVDTKASTEHQILRKSLPKLSRQYVLSIKILVSADLKRYKIFFRYSVKLKDRIEKLKDSIGREVSNIVEWIEMD